MAEKVNEGGGRLPNAQVFKTCLSRASKIEADLSESRGDLGAFIKEAEDKHNIHRKAFKLIRQLDRMDGSKLTEFIRHFDHYRMITKLDDKVGDLFDEDDKEQERGEGGTAEAAGNGAERLAGLSPLHS